ncbi:hypothetical protein ACN0IJ_10390 [Shewanella indica]|uniref:hypothetical protein n=1 Tax=Shewanella indica TaxID=768528 RepID=UPI003D363911
MNGKTNVKVKLLLVNLMIFIGFCCFCGVMFLALPSWVVVIMAVLSMSKVAGEIINKIMSLKKMLPRHLFVKTELCPDPNRQSLFYDTANTVYRN